MYILVVFLPFFSFFLTILFGHKFGKLGSIYINIVSIVSSFLLSFFVLINVLTVKCIIVPKVFNWITGVGLIDIFWGFLFDFLTVWMLFVVTFISSIVHIYSLEYMKQDPNIVRFLSYLSLFTFFMLLLVSADNFVQLFFGWEGVGFSSYLLINFWYTRIEANKAAMKALIINRIGDLGFLFGLVIMYVTFFSFDFSVVFSLVERCSEDKITFPLFFIYYEKVIELNKIDFMMLFLFIGVIGKSAQIGLHMWLPDAMEGPTPVSALIHAATMVTAGVFLLLRSSRILNFCKNTIYFIIVIGFLTAFLAATIALFQNDIKKIIAYSTCSQLGYMVMSCGLSNYSAGFFHLINHAFFKALLFLSAGALIHGLSDEQELTNYNNVFRKILPFTFVLSVWGTFCLLAIPFSTGFYSKDIIIELSFGLFKLNGPYSFTMAVLTALFTCYYSCRLIYLVYLKSEVFSSGVKVFFSHESTFWMLLSLFVLFITSLFVGYLLKEYFVIIGQSLNEISIFEPNRNLYILDPEFIPLYIKLIPSFCFIVGVGFVYLVFYLYDNQKYFFFNLNIYSSILSLKNLIFFYCYDQFLRYLFYNNIIFKNFKLNFFYIVLVKIYLFILIIFKKILKNLKIFFISFRFYFWIINFYIVVTKCFRDLKILSFNICLRKWFRLLRKYIINKLNIDNIVVSLFSFYTSYFGYFFTFKVIDKGFFEIIGPYSLVKFFSNISFFYSKLQSGLIYHYALIIFSILIVFILFIYYFIQLNFIILLDNILFIFVYYIYTNSLKTK